MLGEKREGVRFSVADSGSLWGSEFARKKRIVYIVHTLIEFARSDEIYAE